MRGLVSLRLVLGLKILLEFVTFLRAIQMCANDIRELVRAFERTVFDVALSDRDDYLWSLCRHAVT